LRVALNSDRLTGRALSPVASFGGTEWVPLQRSPPVFFPATPMSEAEIASGARAGRANRHRYRSLHIQTSFSALSVIKL